MKAISCLTYPKNFLKSYSNVSCHPNIFSKSIYFKRNCIKNFSSVNQETQESAVPLTKTSAFKYVKNLSIEEREHLLESLHEVISEEAKAGYKDQLAAFRWRSEFGRPSRLAQLGDVDPTGSYCPLPEDWLLQKYTETVPQPTRKQLIQVAFHNAIPFIGFGFLDNFFMITFGDTIETSVGILMTISTMAAAALGNTISDILGIGSAWYVERAVSKLGFNPPNLLPVQLDMKTTRQVANWGRTIGVTIGCLLGMIPLLFLKPKAENDASPPEDN